MTTTPLFQSFFSGGFECSTHRNPHRTRLDLVRASRHDEFALRDYQRLIAHGIRTAREGLRWHLIERTPGEYDFLTALPFIRAARETNVQIIWDLFHYGYPDDLDIFSSAFVNRFALLARRFAEFLRDETDTIPFICPLNEISFYSWIAGDVGAFAPYAHGRAGELKQQLVRSAIVAIEDLWSVNPQARICHLEPVINVIPHPRKPKDAPAAEGHRQAQYEAWDMIAGRRATYLGGHPKYLDIIGINYYPNNQWVHGGTAITYLDKLYRPFNELIQEVYERYRRPIFIAETGCENEMRPAWLRYICDETRIAIEHGTDFHGICFYPILNHPGWDDDRHCHNGLWDYADDNGERLIYEPLADELRHQQKLFQTHTTAPQP